MTRFLVCYDVLNKVCNYVDFKEYKMGEQSILLEYLQSKDEKIKYQYDPKISILLLDRGFCTPEIIAKLKELNQLFVIRVPSNRKLYKKLIDLKVAQMYDSEIFIDENGKTHTVLVRLINLGFDDENGNPAIVITNMMSNSEYPHSDFAELYAMRWQVELEIRVLKCLAEMDSPNAKKLNTLLIELYNVVLFCNMATILAHDTSIEIEVNSRKRQAEKKQKYAHKINRAEVLGAWHSLGAYLLLGGPDFNRYLNYFLARIRRRTNSCRPDRVGPPRSKRVRTPRPMSYKTVA